MVLISIHPFAVRKIFLLAVALLGLSSVVCFADPLFMTRQYAPSRNQSRSAQTATAPQANLEPSLIWRSFESSAVRCDDMSTIAFFAPVGETGREMGPAFSTRMVGIFSKPPVCWRSDDPKLAWAAPEGASGSTF